MSQLFEQNFSNNNVHLSSYYADLLDNASVIDSLKPLDKQVEEVEPVMRDYQYDISALPVIVSNERVADFNKVIKGLTPICYKAIKTLFAGDNSGFADYLDKPGWVNELLMQFNYDVRDQLCRHDAIFEKGILKLVEINSGSSLGGWQHDCFVELFNGKLARLDLTEQWTLQRNQVVENQFKAQIKAIKRKDRFNTGCHLLFYTGSVPAEQLPALTEFLHKSFNKVRDSELSSLTLTEDLNQLQFDSESKVFYRGNRIDGLLAPLADGDTIDESIQMQLVTSHLKGRLVYPDSAVFNVMNAKSLFALLHDAVEKGVLNEDEVAFVQRHIPWTCKLDGKTVSYQGQTQALEALLIANKDQIVLKKSLSMQGKDVYVGRYVEDEQWREIVATHLGDGGWLAQQYCAADLIEGVAGCGNLGPVDTVWGIFDFNNEYSGAFVRGCVINQDSTGVINSANGAIEFFVYEQGKRQQKLRI